MFCTENVPLVAVDVVVSVAMLFASTATHVWPSDVDSNASVATNVPEMVSASDGAWPTSKTAQLDAVEQSALAAKMNCVSRICACVRTVSARLHATRQTRTRRIVIDHLGL